MKYIIYRITNTINNKQYIGVSKWSAQRRFTRHCWDACRGSTYALHSAIRQYGKDSFLVETIEEHSSEDEAFRQEINLIASHNSFQLGYNMTRGGDRGPTKSGKSNGMYGRHHTLEARRLMSEKKKLLVGRRHPRFGKISPLKGKTYEEILGKERAAALKLKRGESSKNLDRTYQRGENNPAKRPEVRALISEKNSKAVIVDGAEFRSMQDACTKLGISYYKLRKRLGTT